MTRAAARKVPSSVRLGRMPAVRPRIALVVKRSAYAGYLARGDNRLEELLAQNDPAVAHVLPAHEEHEMAVAEVERALVRLRAETTRVVGRRRFDARRFDLVVTVGGDGTLLHASHNVASTPVLGVNSSPTYSVGFFCGARKGDAAAALERALSGRMRALTLTRMQVSLNGRVVSSRVLNDALYCHASPAQTSRYILELDDLVEEQKSSGFWIGPAAGSTAAQRSAGGRVLPLTSDALQLVVREPYTPHGESYTLRRKLIRPGDVLRVRTKMRAVRIFLDGPDHAVAATLGDVVEFAQSPVPLRLLGISPRRRWGPA